MLVWTVHSSKLWASSDRGSHHYLFVQSTVANCEPVQVKEAITLIFAGQFVVVCLTQSQADPSSHALSLTMTAITPFLTYTPANHYPPYHMPAHLILYKSYILSQTATLKMYSHKMSTTSDHSQTMLVYKNDWVTLLQPVSVSLWYLSTYRTSQGQITTLR